MVWLPVDGCRTQVLMAASLVVTNTRSASCRHVGRVVYDFNLGDDVATTIRDVQGDATRLRRPVRRGKVVAAKERAYPARADDADIAMVFGQFPM